MKKTIMALAAIGMMTMMATTALADSKNTGAVGYFDPQISVTQSELIKAADYEMKIKFEGRQVELQKDINALQVEMNTFNEQALKLKEADRNKRLQSLTNRDKALAARRDALNQEMERFRMMVMQEYANLARQAAVEIAKEKGFGSIVNKANTDALYVDGSLDVSQLLLNKINQAWIKKGGKFTDLQSTPAAKK